MILRLKFGGERHLASDVARLTLASWEDTPTGRDTLIPVPSSRKRHRKRGYNQAALLAGAIAAQTGADCRDILRRKSGESQIGVSGIGRSGNVSGKFSAKSGVALQGRVWLIDDVMTTGSTITEVVSTLNDAGYEHIQPGVVCFQNKS